MYKPPLPNETPCEHTVEVLSNHYLLHHLNSASAWLFCPTTNQEHVLGFDAATQHGKLVVIQYKRTRRNDDGTLQIAIDSVQHSTLRTNFPPAKTPYVFYGFSTYREYDELDADYLTVGGPYFFRRMRFVDVHSLPDNCSGLHYSNAHELRYIVKRMGRSVIGCQNGHELVCGLLNCPAGVEFEEFFTLTERREIIGWEGYVPELAILIWGRAKKW